MALFISFVNNMGDVNIYDTERAFKKIKVGPIYKVKTFSG